MNVVDFWSKLIIAEGDFADFKEIEDVYNCIMAVICVICAGLAAGLTMGLLSLDVTKLEIKSLTGSRKEKMAAVTILPIIKKHHLLLVTLLLFNSLANETLPIFLGSLVPNYIAVILSVTLVLVFGEILPSALFTGPNQLLTAAFMTKFVYFLLALFYPIAFPISKLLDCIFGDEVTDGNISRNELEALVIIQGTGYKRANSLVDLESKSNYQNSYNNSNSSLSKSPDILQTPVVASSSPSTLPQHSPCGSGLSDVEVSLMTGILKLSRQSVGDAMIKINDVYMMSSSMRLNHSTLCSVLDSGFSRIPVFKRRDRLCHLGYLLVKELAVVNPGDEIMIETLTLRKPLFVRPNLGLLELLRLFQEGRCHLAMVTADPAQAASSFQLERRQEGRAAILGIVTLEDVLEKVIQKDIRDETDTPYRAAPSLLYHGHISADFLSHSRADLDRAKRERDRERRSKKYSKISTTAIATSAGSSNSGVGLGHSWHSRKGRSSERRQLAKKQRSKRPRGLHSRSSSSKSKDGSKGSSAAMSSSSSPTFSFSDSSFSSENEDNNNNGNYSNSNGSYYNNSKIGGGVRGGVVRVSKGMGEWTKDEPADSNPASSSTIVPFLPTVRNNQSDAVNIELPFHHNNSSSNTLPQSDSTSSCIVVESSFNRLESFEDIDNEESSQLLPKFMDSQSSIIKSTPLVVTNAYQSNSLLKSNINKGVVSEYGAITCGD